MPQLNIGDITLTGSGALQGRVAFHANQGANQANTGSAFKVLFTNALTNVGGGYDTSTSRFTAPVTGIYWMYYQYMMDSSSTYDRSQFKLSGTYVGEQTFQDGGQYTQTNHSIIISMNAGQYMEVWTDVASGGQGAVHGGYRLFQGYLIG
tara:strand:+ start:341 stop:790 length:450 start_codon:yes stop_codon:yes gene_type:complete